ncbi:hypothetical protein DQ04_19971000 [Trypanosoma grayi]|uniref:hypothetical protein n=1 Tax=Trypanosoma grayi TaxID=71804 RepID=UPI0004F45B92|nr:hypothetical protein DQ04_19971000 [Trypanosoma grayi]KEG05618.1 hypothetical protein DQ04_19971000 [Trypanosoma grayi]
MRPHLCVFLGCIWTIRTTLDDSTVFLVVLQLEKHRHLSFVSVWCDGSGVRMIFHSGALRNDTVGLPHEQLLGKPTRLSAHVSCVSAFLGDEIENTTRERKRERKEKVMTKIGIL